jgi:hypothetical protein
MNTELRQTIKAVKEQIDGAPCPLCWAIEADDDGTSEHSEECPLGQLFEYLEEQ